MKPNFAMLNLIFLLFMTNFVIAAENIPDDVKEKLIARRKLLDESTDQLQNFYNKCPRSKSLFTKVFDSLADTQIVKESYNYDLPLRLVVFCSADRRGVNTHMDAGHLRIDATFLEIFESEDEIAFITAHEMAHYLLRHNYLIYMLISRRSDETYRGMNGAYDRYQTARREQEKAADELGLHIMVQAGYDPYAAPEAYTKHILPFLAEQRQGADQFHYDADILIENLHTKISEQGYQAKKRTSIHDRLSLLRELGIRSVWRSFFD